jgi:phage host-nuclease inhibitor protein Gam
MSKVKKTTQASVTLEQAEQAAQQFAQASNRLGTIEAAMNKATEQVRSKYQDEITELKNVLTPDGEIMQTLEAFAIATKDTWDGRSTDLTHARIGFRIGTPRVDTLKGFTQKVALELVKANKSLARDFVRVKEELDKKAILDADAKTKEKLETIAKIVVVQDEAFYVEEHKEQLA